MNGAIIENGVVTNVILLPENFEGDSWGGKPIVISDDAAIGDSYVDGVFVKPAPVVEPETPEQAAKRLELALDAHIDSVARSYRYDSIRTMVTYATSDNLQFGAEGRAAVKFRDACYVKAIQIQDAVQAGQRDIPTEAELISEMPTFESFLE